MGKIYLFKNDLIDIKKGELLGKGVFADVYEYQGKAIKIYKNNIERKTKKNIKKLSNYKNDNYIFPEDLVYLNYRLKGYTQEKVDGITLYELMCALNRDCIDMSFNCFMEEYFKLVKSTKKISDEGISICDLHDQNAMFDGSFKILDTGDYLVDEKTSLDEIYEENMIHLADLFVTMFRNINPGFTTYIYYTLDMKYNKNYMEEFFEIIYKNLGNDGSLRAYKQYTR